MSLNCSNDSKLPTALQLFIVIIDNLLVTADNLHYYFDWHLSFH